MANKKVTNQAQEANAPATSSGLPQVDLLPPEVRDGRRLNGRKRILTYCVLGVLLLMFLTVAVVYVLKVNADSRLDDAQTRATELSTEKKKYSSVTGVLRSIASTKDARDYLISTEISWGDYIDAIASQLPPDVSITNFEVSQASPTSRAPTASDPTVFSGLGTISFTATSADLPNAADWADALNLIPGLQDATIQVATLNEGTSSAGKGKDSYEVQATVQLNEKALSGRTFVDTDIDAASDETATGDKSQATDKGTASDAGTDATGDKEKK